MTPFVSALRAPALIVSFVFFSACGGGGGGGGAGDGTPPSSPPTVDAANSYLPTDPAIRWTYNSNIETRFEAPVTVNGHVVHSLVYPTGGKEYFVTSAGQVSLEGIYLPYINVGDGVIYTGDVHFDAPVVTFENGWTSFTGRGVSGKGSIYVSPTYGSQPFTYSGGINYTADIPVYTKQGIYTAKVVSVSLDLAVSVKGSVFSIPYSVNFFFVDGLGIIKRVQDSVDYTLTAVTGLDQDNDGVLNAYDRFPADGNRWEVAPLYASDDGIALVSLPSHARLEQTVTVMHGNGPAPVAWNAAADQSWLSVVQESGGRLRIVADPVGLAPDVLYEGTVSIQSDSADVSAPAVVRVGLWVGSQDAPTVSLQTVGSENIVVDPVRPYIYVQEGTDFSIYNIYTESKIGSLGVSLTDVPAFASSDGAFLYVHVGGSLWQVSLEPPYPAQPLLSTGPDWVLGYARPQGHPIILDQFGGVFEAATGVKLVHREWVDPVRAVPPVASVQGNRVCGVLSNGWLELQCYELSFVDGQYHDVRVKTLGKDDSLPGYTFDLAVSDDGAAVYVGTGLGGVIRYDTVNVGGASRLGTPGNWASIVELSADGSIYAGDDTDIYRFDQYSSLIDTFHLGTSLPRVSISSDGAVLMDGELSNLTFRRTY